MKTGRGKKAAALLAFILVIAMLFSACGKTTDTPVPVQPAEADASVPDAMPGGAEDPVAADVTEPGPEPDPDAELKEQIAAMSLEDKILQLFIVRPHLAGEYKGRVGGYILFADDIHTEAQLKNLTAELSMPAQYNMPFVGTESDEGSEAIPETFFIPPFIAVDEEGGDVARVANARIGVKNTGSMGNVGKTGDPANAFFAGYSIGSYLKDFGFNLDFAPDTDVNTNPNNPVIGKRAFGSDPELVSTMANAFLDGLHANSVLGVIKHYPGHGDTKSDTHTGYVQVDKTWDKLLECELIPFMECMDKADAIMAAHITLPNVSDDGLPASLSKQLIQEKLRGELGWDGLVVTDSLAMGAITKKYSPAEAAVLAVKAGCDLLLMPDDLEKAVQGILGAVEDGSVPEERIDESLLRIMKVKNRL